MILAVIPARGGSKRISRKNIKLFAGRPILAWSISAAVRSNCFDRVLVSTEDAEIAEVARACGAETPFIRPMELADDYTGTIPVIAHAINWEIEHGNRPTAVCCIYATAPLLLPNDLSRGLKVLQEEQCDYAFGVTSYAFPIHRALRVTADSRIEMFSPQYQGTRSQDLETAWHDAGQFYWGRADAWLNARPIFSKFAAPVFLPRHRVQDIDTPEDWERAEWLFQLQRSIDNSE